MVHIYIYIYIYGGLSTETRTNVRCTGRQCQHSPSTSSESWPHSLTVEQAKQLFIFLAEHFCPAVLLFFGLGKSWLTALEIKVTHRKEQSIEYSTIKMCRPRKTCQDIQVARTCSLWPKNERPASADFGPKVVFIVFPAFGLCAILGHIL